MSDSIQAFLSQMECAQNEHQLMQLEQQLDQHLKSLSRTKSKVRRKRRRIQQGGPQTELDRHIQTLAELDAEYTFRQHNVRHKLKELVSQHPDGLKAKRLISSVKRKSRSALQARFDDLQVDPCLYTLYSRARRDAITYTQTRSHVSYECAICADTHTIESNPSVTCSNGHAFCVESIVEWAKSGRSNSKRCPMCRCDMTTQMRVYL